MKSLEREIKKDELKAKYGDYKKNIYKQLSVIYHLPKINSPNINRDYLDALDRENVLFAHKRDVEDFTEKIYLTKEELYCYFLSKNKLPYGFSICNMPPKKWLLEILFVNHKDDPIFEYIFRIRDFNNEELTPNLLNEIEQLKIYHKNYMLYLKNNLRNLVKDLFKKVLREKLTKMCENYPFLRINDFLNM